MRFLRRWRGLILCVLLPTAIAGTYLYGIAAGQYGSEAVVLVRGRGGANSGAASMAGASGGMSSMLASAGFTSAAAETMAVREFLRSADAVARVRAQLDLVAIWRRPEADPLARLWDPEPSAERLLRYYRGMVSAEFDSESGAITLTVRTFRPEDSKALAETLLGAAEALVNRLSERQREDTLSTARAEVAIAEARVTAARDAVTRFRQSERAIDPTREAGSSLDNVARLEAALAAARAELAEKTFFLRPDNPQVATLRNRIESTERQIAEERARLTASTSALPQQLAGYERLLLERDFADRQLGSATTGLETARVEAQRQQLYVARVVEPRQAETAEYPRAGFALGTIFAVLLVVYGIATLLLAGFREHAS